MNVELRNFVAFARSNIGDVDADLGCPARYNLRRFDAHIRKPERGVAEPKAKRE